jgi:hypothetical protein
MLAALRDCTQSHIALSRFYSVWAGKRWYLCGQSFIRSLLSFLHAAEQNLAR